MSRAVLLLPGAGAYRRASLGSLPAHDRHVAEADALRREAGLPTLTEIDGAASFEPSVHGQPIHAMPLAYLLGVLAVERAQRDHEVVAVTASSIGWYTALAVAGALSFDDGLRLVHEIASVEQQAERGVQLVYPLTDANWRPHPALRAALDAALAAAGDRVSVVQELGPHVILGGEPSAVERCFSALRPVQIGERRFPRRIHRAALHGTTSARLPDDAVLRLAALHWRRPEITLIDGRGARHAPWSSDPGRLREYTLHELRAAPARFADSVRVALREYAPDVLIALGPGRSLAAVAAQLMVAEGYRGLRTRAAFEAAQQHGTLVLSTAA